MSFFAGFCFGYAVHWYSASHPGWLPSLWLKVKAFFGK
jgi:hypothetical protein